MCGGRLTVVGKEVAYAEHCGERLRSWEDVGTNDRVYAGYEAERNSYCLRLECSGGRSDRCDLPP